jgi:hypothetical protein
MFSKGASPAVYEVSTFSIHLPKLDTVCSCPSGYEAGALWFYLYFPDNKWDRSFFCFLFFSFAIWDLNSGPTCQATLPDLFCYGFFWDRVLWTVCPGWPRTTILLISVSWIARIIGINQWCPARCIFLMCLLDTCISLLKKCLFWCFTHFRIGIFTFLKLI